MANLQMQTYFVSKIMLQNLAVILQQLCYGKISFAVSVQVIWGDHADDQGRISTRISEDCLAQPGTNSVKHFAKISASVISISHDGFSFTNCNLYH